MQRTLRRFMTRPASSGRSRRRTPRPTIARVQPTGAAQQLPSTDAGAGRDTPRYWLLKSEPESRIVLGQDVKFSVDDLAALPGRTTSWEGVRNYQARNLMRDEMKAGDLAFFYHSSCPDPGIVGVVQVVRESHPDPTSWDRSSPYFDPKSSPEAPRWFMVEVQLVERLPRPISLRCLRQHADRLPGLPLLSKGSRLSVQRVPAPCWDAILALQDSDDV